MRPVLYNDADMKESLIVELTDKEREQLFRLKGYLEGIGAPKVMSEVFNDALAFLTMPHEVGPARFDRRKNVPV